MRLRVIACEVLTREVCYCVARGPHVCDVEFLAKNAHDEPDRFREIIQARIDDVVDSRPCDAVVLAFGLCGNTTAGLVARNGPLVIPRAHDCCTLFLGSKQAFHTHFEANPSRPFSSTGYLEHDGFHDPGDRNISAMGLGEDYATYVEQYGEENARFIWESLNGSASTAHADPTSVFIDIPETTRPGDAERCRERAEQEGREFVILPGSLDLVRKLVEGDWDTDSFVTVPPGHRLKARYDWDRVIDSVPVDEETRPAPQGDA